MNAAQPKIYRVCYGSGIADNDNPEVRKLNEQLNKLDSDEPLLDLLPAWKQVFRKGILPLVSEVELNTLKDLLKRDDQRLLQGATTTPPPLMCVQDWPVEAACPIGMCGWSCLSSGELGEVTVGEVEEYFARMCYDIDQRIGEPAACRYFLNWWDETPRDEALRELLTEVNLALNKR